MGIDKPALAAVAVIAIVAAGCRNAGTTSVQSSTNRSPGVTSLPTALETPKSTTNSFTVLPPAAPVAAASEARLSGIACSGAIGTSDPVAVVTLHSGGQVLRDYADPLHPRTACTFPPDLFGISLIDAHHIVVSVYADLFAVVDLPEVRYSWFQLPTPSGEFSDFVAVSPGLDEVVYLSADLTDNTDKVHLATRSGDQVVASLPNPHGGRCGSPEDSKLGAYTHSGAHLFVLDQPFPTLNSLLLMQGATTVLKVTPPGSVPQGGWAQGAQPAMAVWS
ncbi:MAG TPA: hypothetical protein VET26_07050, partial [Candidatus Sulfotelmatobacter sp.]|nr:hypothetical protein [Candidatus Sulfotelmatobacter sp.]